MVNYINVQIVQDCLDNYMLRTGKTEINEIEANCELAKAGIMEDDEVFPGKPLRRFLIGLRDSNQLPKNISQTHSAWAIKHSRAVAKMHQHSQYYYG